MGRLKKIQVGDNYSDENELYTKNTKDMQKNSSIIFLVGGSQYQAIISTTSASTTFSSASTTFTLIMFEKCIWRN